MYTEQPPIRSLVVPIARDICPLVIERAYSTLDTVRDAEAIREVCRLASLVRYVQMGLTPHWVPREELELARKLALATAP
jgi:hypothetical protein